jgi:hypothetical protein
MYCSVFGLANVLVLLRPKQTIAALAQETRWIVIDNESRGNRFKSAVRDSSVQLWMLGGHVEFSNCRGSDAGAIDSGVLSEIHRSNVVCWEDT